MPGVTLVKNETASSLQKIAQTMTQVAWIALPDGRVDFVNERGLKYLGVDMEQAQGWGWSKSFAVADFIQLKALFVESRKKDADFEFQCQIVHGPSRLDRPNTIQAVAVRDSAGVIENWFVTCTDLELLESIESITPEHGFQVQLQQVIDSIPGPIWWKDKDYKYLGCNTEAAKKAGLNSPSDIVGKTDYDLHWAEQAENFNAGDRIAMERKEGQYHELQAIDFDGNTTWFDTYKVAIYDTDGKVAGTVGSSLDVTSLIKLTEQREDFMASLAHDLKVPIIGAIRAFEVLSEGLVGPLTDDQKLFVRKLEQSHQHLLALIKNLLQVLRYEASADVLTINKCNLTRLFQSCLAEIQGMAQDKSIEIQEQFPKECIVMADPLALNRLFTNLVSNAIKFTPRHGLIKVSVHEQGDTVSISVTDTGAGISREDQKKLFQRFWQGGDVKKYAAETGLGLYLCRQIAQGHGGSISVESEEGHGAVFTVILPLRGPDKPVIMRLEG